MKVGTILHGFAVQRVRELDELQAKLWEMEHIKSGAQLCWLERGTKTRHFPLPSRHYRRTPPVYSTFWSIRCCAARTNTR